MSFYGNVYQVIYAAFTKIILKNLGYGVTSFIPNGTAEGEITTNSKQGYFYVDTGNSWIQIEPDKNGFKIWHSAPHDGDGVKVFQGISKTTDTTQAVELSDGDYLKVPLIYYDEAGHIVHAREGSVIYRLPDLTKLYNRVDILESELNDANEKIDQNTTNISELAKRVTTNENNIAENAKNIAKNTENITINQNNISNLDNQNQAIRERLSTTEKDIEALKAASGSLECKVAVITLTKIEGNYQADKTYLQIKSLIETDSSQSVILYYAGQEQDDEQAGYYILHKLDDNNGYMQFYKVTTEGSTTKDAVLLNMFFTCDNTDTWVFTDRQVLSNVLSTSQYGTSLPSTTQEGQVYFLIE